jgi:hypothetical protein
VSDARCARSRYSFSIHGVQKSAEHESIPQKMRKGPPGFCLNRKNKCKV